MKFTNVLLALAAVTVSSVSAQFTNLVNGATYPIQYDASNYTINPHPMCIGKEFCLTARGIFSAPLIEGATFDIIGMFLGRYFYTDNGELCAVLAASG
ncbi:hypothetical protein BGW39_011473 [Mortierella sp. 14UC]|nr:hypothetical protein BGW39_011473 [Mortierella sp. 14UC]